jgi:hypothetical protein
MLLSTVANAMEDNEKRCLRNAFDDWSEAFILYWEQIGIELKKANPDIYSEFQYLIQEQKNNNRLAQITLDYLLDNHPEELRLSGKVHGLAPGYLNYHQKIHRELRNISEFDRLFLENQSYSHNIKNPDFNRLENVSQLMADIRSTPSVTLLSKEVLKKGDVLISELNCGSYTRPEVVRQQK